MLLDTENISTSVGNSKKESTRKYKKVQERMSFADRFLRLRKLGGGTAEEAWSAVR